MERDVLSAGIGRPDTCPPVLRTVLERWKRHQATPEELQAATFTVALDDLEGMRYQAPPSVPAEVREYRALSAEASAKLSEKAREALFTKHKGFFTCERQRELDNLANRPFLDRLLAWASGEAKPEGVIRAIRSSLASYAWQNEK